MKNVINNTTKILRADKPLFRICILIAILAVLAALSLVVRLSITDLQIATRFTAFGETQYYRNQWYYLLTFIVFVLTVGSFHIALIAKMKQREMREHALLFGSMTVVMLVVVSLISHAVFSVAYLS